MNKLKEIERIHNNDYFNIDTNKIYIKDEYGNIIYFDRKMFYAIKKIGEWKKWI